MSSPVDTVEGDSIVRFDRAERWVHATTGVLLLTLMTTAAFLYFDFLSGIVARRALLKDVHVISGLLLPLPLLAGLAGPWRSGLRRDAARLGRWTGEDRRWLRSAGRDRSVRLGKFNGGQKVYAMFVAGVLPVMLLSGSVMKWFSPFPDTWRTGATFVHDLGGYGVWLAVTVHIAKALSEPVLLRAMAAGTVPASWAERHRPRWHSSVVGAVEEPVGVDP